jgi:hypothetical protein
MADAPTLSPEVSRSVLALARTLVAAARGRALYPPEHPAVRGSLDRLHAAIADANGEQICSFGVTPDTLLVAGVPSEGREPVADGEAARGLHDRDVMLEEAMRINTWEPDGRGDFTGAVVEAVDPEAAGIDPLKYM